jgi:regulator of sigma E protease
MAGGIVMGIGQTLLIFLEFILGFGLLVFIHELGHYLTARLNGIEVTEFGFGYPPRLWKFGNIGKTEFSLNWIPFGGFCSWKEHTNENEIVPGSYQAVKPWRRLVTIAGGSVFNLLFGVIIFVILFTKTGAPNQQKVVIDSITSQSPVVDVLVGDIIDQINGTPINSVNKFSSIVSVNLGTQVEVVVIRDSESIKTLITPRIDFPSNEGPLGVKIINPIEKIRFFSGNFPGTRHNC